MVDERDKFHADCFVLPFTKEMRDRIECGMQPYTLCLIQLNMECTHLAQQPEGFLRSMRKRSAVERTTATNAITIPTNELFKDFRHAL
jgi:hypothetical protein